MSSILDPVTGALTVAGYRVGWQAVRRLPAPVAYGIFQAMADAAVLRGGKGVRRLRSNYAKVRPELDDKALDDLVRDGMRSYMRYFCEAFRLPDMSSTQLADAVVATGHEAARTHLDQGRGVTCFIGHMGNFDLGGAWSTTHLWPVTTIAERLEPEEVFQDFLRFRTELGMTIVPLTGGPKPFDAMREALHHGAFVPLPADRDLTANGVEVDLCGHRARVAKGPAALAVATGAALFTAAVWYEDAPPGKGVGGKVVRVEFSEQIEPRADLDGDAAVRELTQRCVDFLGARITQHTSAWHMLQRVFVDDLDPARQRTP